MLKKSSRFGSVNGATAWKPDGGYTWAELQNNQSAQMDSSQSSIAGKAYNADFRGHLDSVNQDLYGVTTLINDKSWVYKGGSWNDRAYWLNPATRRHMQQDDSDAEIGFRCAMTLVGAPEIISKGKPQFAQPKSKSQKRIR